MRTSISDCCHNVENIAGQLLLAVTLGSDPRGRWFDSNSRNSKKTEVIRPDEEPVLKTGGGVNRL